MQEVTTPNGNKFRIRPLTQAMSERASRQLQAEGVKLQGNNSLMHENIDFAAELARQAIDSWQGPEGNEPVAGMLPKVARKVIKETPGLFDMIIAVATKQAEQEAEGWRVELGN